MFSVCRIFHKYWKNMAQMEVDPAHGRVVLYLLKTKDSNSNMANRTHINLPFDYVLFCSKNEHFDKESCH